MLQQLFNIFSTKSALKISDLEREKAKLERLEQQQKASEEKQRAKRAEQLKRIRAEQEQVEMQVKKVTEHSGSGRKRSEVAEQSERERLPAKEAKKESARRPEQANANRDLTLANERALVAQRQKDEARRLVAEAEQLKKRLTAEKAKASLPSAATKKRNSIESSVPNNQTKSRDEHVEAELMNWVSKKHSTATKTKPLNGKAKALVQKSSIGSEPTTPRQSKLSAAVSQVAKERSPQRATPNGAKRNSSRLSLAVAAAAQQRSTTTPQKTPVTPSTPKLANPAVVDAEMEIMNWLQNKK